MNSFTAGTITFALIRYEGSHIIRWRYLLFIFVFENVCAEKLSPLLIKGDNNYPPYEYLNEKNEPDGFNVDIIRAVAREMGFQIRIELDTWAQVRSEIETGKKRYWSKKVIWDTISWLKTVLQILYY